MVRLKDRLIVGTAAFGLFAAPAQAFGPMMLLMVPMMMGGHQHGGDTGHGSSTVGHVDAPHEAVHTKQDDPLDEGRSPRIPQVLPQHADSRNASPTDAERDR